ncbi:MAG TPA: hypothetical protein VKV25_05770, partial [Acidimicrobiales bacterium]|nr:hypothetical protein [Acidimicrobiales bacterium]
MAGTLLAGGPAGADSALVTPTADAPVPAPLYAVSCTSASFCMAVGDYAGTSGAAQTLAEVYNGTSWSRTTTVNPAATADNKLVGVSCVSTSFCVAVGYYIGPNGSAQTLAETYNGTSWSQATTVNPSATASNTLAAVSCSSSSFCVAVGYYMLGSYAQTLAEIYNGSSWSQAATVNPAATASNELVGVSCTAVSFCVAVGYYGASSAAQTLAEIYNGTSWSQAATANPSANDALYAVSCVSTSFCVAVGYNPPQTLAEVYNGSSWSQSATVNPAANDELLGVSCTSSSFCMAVGYGGAFGVAVTVAETYNGTSWTSLSPASPDGISGDALYATSCPSSGTCLAVGSRYNAPQSSLAELWAAGAWSVASPPPPAVYPDQLMAVSCVSFEFCMAVGYYSASGHSQALAETFSRGAWSLGPWPANPAGPGADNRLLGVSCSSASFCVAVGYYTDSNGYSQTLAETYNGTS